MLNFILRGGALGLASALFGILLLLAFVLTHQMSWKVPSIYRYDVLLAYALIIQVFLVYFKLETPREMDHCYFSYYGHGNGAVFNPSQNWFLVLS